MPERHVIEVGEAARRRTAAYSKGVSILPETLLDLALSRGALDRGGNARRDIDVIKRALGKSETRIYDLVESKMRTCRVDGQLRLVPRPGEMADSKRLALYIGRDSEQRDYVVVVRAEGDRGRPDSNAKGWLSLREAGVDLGDIDAGVFTTGVALANWHERHTCCPRCGSETTVAEGGWVRACEVDGSEHHPRTEPAVIMAVTDDEDRLLLGRGPHWPEGRMSVLAGFVEAGESLESAVAREVFEEVGVEVTDVLYRGNQPWPFPASLMVGFTAKAKTSELTLDPAEIVEAAWFSKGELAWAVHTGRVALPPRVSIARRLVEQWYGGELEQQVEHSNFRGQAAQ